MTERHFRLLIILNWVLIIITFVLIFALEYTLPTVLRHYLQAQAEAPLSLRDGLIFGIGFLFFLVYVAATIGLYLFKAWARSLFLISTAAGYLITPFIGPIVEPAIATVFNYLVSFVGGMILAVIYYTPISSRFERTDSSSTDVAFNP